jgi:predicted secreted hydrolase
MKQTTECLRVGTPEQRPAGASGIGSLLKKEYQSRPLRLAATPASRYSAVVTLTAFLFLMTFPTFVRADWKRAAPGYAWSFPRDHLAHPDYKNEWWYLTGQFQTDENPPQHFGYQFTIFRLGISTAPAGNGSAWQSGQMLMGHMALTDIDAQKHFFTDALTRETPFLGTFATRISSQPMAWMVGPPGISEPWTIHWEKNGFHIQAQTSDFAFDLHTHSDKPVVFEGPQGLSRKTSDGSSASLYYSFTQLKTVGQLTYQDRATSVHGLSWMDKEFGSDALAKDQVGWDWFSLQFTDGHELMLYVMRKADGGVSHAQGTLVDREGHTKYLRDSDFQIQVTDHWKSPNGAHYSSAWNISLGPTMHISALVPDQENRGRRVSSINYWEGAVTIQDAAGKKIGQGYVELTGYK